jgi:Domain of unknown function (DUF3859)
MEPFALVCRDAMHRTRALLSAAAVTLLVACTASQMRAAPRDIESVHAGITPRVLESGVFELTGDTVDSDAGRTAAGKVSEHKGVKLVRDTLTLDARKGVAFGFRYRLTSNREGPLPGLEMQVSHPPMRGVDGKTHTLSTAPTSVEFESGVAENDIVYILSEDFEVLPGAWTLRLLLDGNVLISRTFLLK